MPLPAPLDLSASTRWTRGFLERLVETAPVAMAIVEGMELRFTLVNAAYRGIEGANRAPEVGLTYPDVFPEAAGQGAAERLREVIRTGKPWSVRGFETRLGHRAETWWEGECLPLESDDGERDAVLIVTWDVTDRVVAEKHLRESEALFRTLGESSPDFLWLSDGEGRPLYQNPAWRAYTGLDGDNLSAGGWESLHHPDEVEASRRVWEEAAARAVPLDFEGRLRRHDGAYRWFSGRTVPLKDGRGRVIRWLGTLTDIHERKLAEQRLRDSEERLQLAVTAGDAATWDLDLATERLVGSDSFFRMLGQPLTHDRATSCDRWREAVLDADRGAFAAEWERARAARDVFRSEHRIARSDGSIVWVNAAGRFVYDERGAAVRFVGISFDITKRKEAEQRLSETAASLGRERERLSIALRTGALGAYEWRVGDNQVWWSPETYPLFGVDPSFVVTVDSFNALIHPEDRAELWRKTEESVARGEVFRHEYRVVHPNGTVRWMFNQSHVGLDAEGRVERITGVAADITDRRAAEQALRDSEEALKEADRKKDEFLGILAHELRNPLAPIRSGLEVMKLAKGDLGVIERCRSMMERQVNQMVHLIDDLMDLTRITQGKVVLQKRRMPIASAVRDAIDASAPLIERQGHALSVDWPQEPLEVEGDGTRLAQVFANLLNNAAKYTERGGRIRIGVERNGHEAVVTVEDNGVGIPAPMLPRIFDIFTQVDRSLEKAQGGLGIGLNIVKRLVEMHGGRVEASSAGLGQGARFVVRLPVAVVSEAAAPDALANAAPAPSRRILVVDDNEDGASSLAEMLSIMGNETKTARDGHEAVEVAETWRPDVILMDIGMPQLNGYEACRRIRAAPWGRGIVIVAQTGWGQDEDRRRSHETGFDFHLVKPIDPGKLATLLAGWKRVES